MMLTRTPVGFCRDAWGCSTSPASLLCALRSFRHIKAPCSQQHTQRGQTLLPVCSRLPDRKTKVWRGKRHKSQNFNPQPETAVLGRARGYGWSLEATPKPCWQPRIISGEKLLISRGSASSVEACRALSILSSAQKPRYDGNKGHQVELEGRSALRGWSPPP